LPDDAGHLSWLARRLLSESEKNVREPVDVKHAFRNQGPVDRFLNLIVAAAGTGVVIGLGQALGYRVVGIDGAADPIAATQRYGMLIMWVVNPAAALVAGALLRTTGWRRRVALIGVACALAPLWVSWFAAAEVGAASFAHV
jgi:hypothetical protein